MGDFSWGMVMVVAIVWTVMVAVIAIWLGEKWIEQRGEAQSSLANIEQRLERIQAALDIMDRDQRLRYDDLRHVQAQMELRQRAELPPGAASSPPR
jgi:membrane protein implicated in regulation of membrane protease activity